MIRFTEDTESADKHLLETGLTCFYDDEPIEYMDLVILIQMIKPFDVNGQVLFYDITTEDGDDYLYEPVLFHGKNWDELEEELERFVRDHPAIEQVGSVATCRFCKSGILPGETTGVALIGEIHRSHRNPDLRSYGNQFEPLNTAPIVICISCMQCFNSEVQTLWEEGVCHDNECSRGTYARCWRSGCPGGCILKEEENAEAAEENQ